MSLDINVNFTFPGILPFLNELKGLLMSTQAEITQGLTDATALLVKIAGESAATLQKVADLEIVIASQNPGSVTPELQAAFEALKAQVNVVDALVPDTPAAPAVV